MSLSKINSEYQQLSNADQRALSSSWETFKNWVKRSLMPGVLINATWDAIKVFWSGLSLGGSGGSSSGGGFLDFLDF